MFEPKYLIRLDNKAFLPEQVVCLGSQLKSVIKNLSELIEAHVWFCADVDAISPIPKKLEINSGQLKKLGHNSSLINLCENIDQFLSGVFIAIIEKNENLKIPNLHIGTEDEQFRPLEDLDGVLVEIRAFDTSYFELYSEDAILMKKLSKIYDVKIENKRRISPLL